MKKIFTICMALTLIMCIGSLNAQQTRKYDPPLLKAVKAHTQELPATKGTVIYTEGFEGTTGTNLPTGWTKILTAWVGLTNNLDNLPGVTGISPAFNGERTMARSWQSANQNAWAFTPAIALTAGNQYTIKFWFMAPGWPELSEFDNFEVKIGPTASAEGMTNLVFSHINILTTDWEQVSSNFVPTVSGNYYLGFHNLNTSPAGIYVMIDDIEITDNGVIELCPPITNLTTEIQGTDLKLTWTAAEGTPTGYKVYNGVAVLGTVTTTQYLATNLAFGVHTLGVEALYADGCAPVKVTTTVNMPLALNPIKNLNGTCVDGELDLTWTKPDIINAGYENWLTHTTGDWGGGVGYGTSLQPINVYWANRWSPADLATLGVKTGAEISKMRFVFSTMPENVPPIPINDGTYKLKVWQGGTTTTCGTEKYSQDVSFSSLVGGGEWNEFILTTPVIIDASQELWIGIHSDVTTGNPVANDKGPVVTGGSVYKIGSPTGAWTSNPVFNNYMVAGYVVSEGEVIEVSHYNIYQDNVKYGESDITTFTKEGVSGKYNYCVVAVYENDSQSKKVCRSIDCICEPAKNLNVTYAPDCLSAELTWTLPKPTATVNIYRNTTDNLIAANYSGESFIDDDFENLGHTWIVKLICANGDEAAPAIKNMGICVGIKDNVKTTFSIVPNPATNNIKVSAASDFHTIEIVSFLGQTVYSQPNVGNTTTIDVSNFSNGIYFVRIISENFTNTKKFVKQ
jgi:hypothetical protein